MVYAHSKEDSLKGVVNMKKHIFGAILFSLIVSVSGIIAFIFAELPKPDKIAVLNVPTFESRSYCHKKNYRSYKNDAVSVKVVQAVFNERTKLLDTDLLIERGDSSRQTVTVALHFFAKDLKGARYLASENYRLSPDFNSSSEATQAIPSRAYRWLDDLTAQENLYVIADMNFGDTDYRKKQPSFDEAKAFSVISIKGK